MPCRECGGPNHNRASCEIRVMREAFSVLNADPTSILSEHEEVKRNSVRDIVILLRLVQCERLDHIVVYNTYDTVTKYKKNTETGEITSSPSNTDERIIYRELIRSRPVLSEELEKYRNNPTTYTLASIAPASDWQKKRRNPEAQCGGRARTRYHRTTGTRQTRTRGIAGKTQ